MSRFVSLSADDVKVSDVILTDEKGGVLGSIYVENNRFIFNPPLSNLTAGLEGGVGPAGLEGPTGQQGPTGFIEEISYEDRIGPIGDFITGINGSQSSNVVSYNNNSKKVTFRDLGLYNESLPDLPKTGSENDYRIVSKHSIIPDIDGLIGNQGYSLGNDKSYWNSIYVKDINMSNKGIYIKDNENNESMSVSFDPMTLRSTISNNSATVQSVNTSMFIANQIDASLIPFSGFTYVGKFNPFTYKNNIGNSFDEQTNNLIYNLQYKILTESQNFTGIPATKTNMIYQLLSGIYYVVSGLGDKVISNINFSTIAIPIDLEVFDKGAAGNFISEPIITNTKTLPIGDNDMIVLTIGVEPINGGGNMIVFDWIPMQFRVPIAGITTANIVDGAITNNKLGINSVSYLNLQNNSVGSVHLQNLSVINSKIAENAVTLTKLSPDVQAMLEKGGSAASENAVGSILTTINSLSQTVLTLQNNIQNDFYKMERRILAMEEFINTMLVTYKICNPIGTEYKYTAKLQYYVNNYSIEFYNRTETAIRLVIDDYTYNIFEGTIDVVTVQRMIKRTLTRNDFGSLSKTTSLSTEDITQNNYPLTIVLKDRQGGELLTKYLSYPMYLEIPLTN
jgi:hypothetical protein